MKVFVWLFFTLVASTALGQHSTGVVFTEDVFEFGNVPENKGAAVHDFVLTNKSNRPVRIISVTASCGCTTPAWTQEPIAPGKTGFIKASFNPVGRPGFFHKTLTVTTDYQPTTPITLSITGTVIPESGPLPTDFQAINGAWRLKASAFNMGKVFKTAEPTIRDFQFYNAGDKPITITGKVISPAYIRVEVTPKVVQKGEKGTLRIQYLGLQRPGYGFNSDNIEIPTDDEMMPVKSFSVMATLEDKPVVVTETAIPVSRPAQFHFDFGSVKLNQTAVREIPITNQGKADLIIKSLQGNCTCIQVSAAKNILKPGESAALVVRFTPVDRKGTQTKAIALYTNDPVNPVQRITFQAVVTD